MSLLPRRITAARRDAANPDDGDRAVYGDLAALLRRFQQHGPTVPPGRDKDAQGHSIATYAWADEDAT